jgi:gamma-glutamyltranspeptidase/glutathione hydrolase
MRRDTGGSKDRQARNGRRPRQLRKLALVCVLLAAGCGGSEPDKENIANPSGIAANRAPLSNLLRGVAFAAVAADESRAAEVGRDMLQGGGNATDAAVAMYFAMAVTLPSAASLGASGVCVVHDPKTKAGMAYAFPPVTAPGGIRGTSITVPSGGVRAMTLMHTRHGQARWEATVAPGERLARIGVPVSRALARDLQAGAVALGADSEARRIYGRGTGTAVTEGDNFIQTDLAATLGTIRQRGGGDFFQGPLARRIADQVSTLGGSMPLESIRNTVPQAGPPMEERFGGFRVYVAPAPMAGAMALAGWNGQPGPGGGVPTDSNGFAGFAAVDDKGGAVACSLSMGQLFGARIIVPGTGVLLGTSTPDSTAISPLVIGNPGNGEVLFAGAGGGSSAVPYGLGAVARGTIEKKHYVAAALKARGGQGGYLDVIACPDGIKSGGANCNSAADPAGTGLALLATNR